MTLQGDYEPAGFFRAFGVAGANIDATLQQPTLFGNALFARLDLPRSLDGPSTVDVMYVVADTPTDPEGTASVLVHTGCYRIEG